MSNIQLRNKFLKACPNVETQNQVISECEYLCTLSPEHAITYLWKKFIEAHDPNENVDSSKFNLMVWRELRSQYTVAHPGFPQVFVPDSCQKSYATFAEVNPVVAAVVTNITISYIKRNMPMICRTSFLLNSDKEANYFGGIRELGFSYAESTILKSFISQIREIFDSLCTYYQAIDLSQEELPFSFSSEDESETSTLQSTIEEVNEEDLEFKHEALALIILQNRQIIEEFFQIADSFETLGLNPEEILNKKDVIKDFLMVANKL